MNGDRYAISQELKEQEYKSEYLKWVESLSDKDRNLLEAMGLEKPLVEARGVGSPELDEARIEQHGHDPFRVEDVEEGRRADSTFPPERAGLQDCLRSMVAELFSSESPNLALGIICVALEGDQTPRTVANRHRKSMKWVNERATEMQFRLGVISREDKKALRAVAGDIASQNKTRMSMEVLALVSGICYKGISETAIAKRHGVTRAAVSKRCVELCERMGLPPSRAMKSEEAREIYSVAQSEYYQSLMSAGYSREEIDEAETEGRKIKLNT